MGGCLRERRREALALWGSLETFKDLTILCLEAQEVCWTDMERAFRAENRVCGRGAKVCVCLCVCVLVCWWTGKRGG